MYSDISLHLMKPYISDIALYRWCIPTSLMHPWMSASGTEEEFNQTWTKIPTVESPVPLELSPEDDLIFWVYSRVSTMNPVVNPDTSFIWRFHPAAVVCSKSNLFLVWLSESNCAEWNVHEGRRSTRWRCWSSVRTRCGPSAPLKGLLMERETRRVWPVRACARACVCHLQQPCEFRCGLNKHHDEHFIVRSQCTQVMCLVLVKYHHCWYLIPVCLCVCVSVCVCDRETGEERWLSSGSSRPPIYERSVRGGHGVTESSKHNLNLSVVHVEKNCLCDPRRTDNCWLMMS